MTLGKTGLSVKKKIIEIGIEIFIISFAVTLSIWLHSYSEHQHQQKEVKVFLINLKNDVIQDKQKLTEGKEQLLESNENYHKLLALNTKQFDSLERAKSKIVFHVQAQGKKINDGNFEGFKSSGKLGYLENEKLKQLLLLYYQNNLPDIITMDNFYNQFLFKTIDIKVDNAGKEDKDLYSNPRLRESIHYLMMIGKSNAKNYDEAGLKKADEIIQEIQKVLKKEFF